MSIYVKTSKNVTEIVDKDLRNLNANAEYITYKENQEKDLIKELKSEGIKEYTNLINFIKNTKSIEIDDFVLKIIELTDIQNKVHSLINILVNENIIYETDDEYINLHDNEIVNLKFNQVINQNFIQEIVSQTKEFFENKKESDKSELIKFINKNTPHVQF